MAKNRVKKYGSWGGFLFIFSLFFWYILLPPIVKMQVKDQVQLRPGKFMRGVWGALPFPLEFNVYLFNISNPDEITKGEKPIVKEIGPFVYDEWQEKTNQVDYEEDDSVSFTTKYTYYFNAEKSNGLTGDEELTVPNYFILGVVNTIKRESPTLMPIIGKGIASIFQKPSNIFMKQKVKDILFNGFIINCTVKDFAGSSICAEIKKHYEEMHLKKVDEDIYSMSLFGSANGTENKEKIRVYRGKKDLMKVGEVIEYNGNPNISVWDDESCDTLNGTDGTIYHPYYKRHDYLGVFAEALCRILSFDYVADVKAAGVSTYRYTTSMGTDPANNPRDKCYCATPDTCPLKGAFDTYKCTKTPIIVTNPHFYLADPHYLSSIEGLSPDKEKHMLFIDLEPMSGAPIYARSRAQLNMLMTRMEKFKLMKEVPEALLPLLWFDNVLHLPDFLLKNVKDGIHQLFLANVFHYLMMLSGMIMCGYAAFLHCTSGKSKNNLDTKKTMSPTKGISRSNSIDNNIMTLNAGKLQPAQVPSRIDL